MPASARCCLPATLCHIRTGEPANRDTNAANLQVVAIGKTNRERKRFRPEQLFFRIVHQAVQCRWSHDHKNHARTGRMWTPAGSHCRGTLFRTSPDSPGILQNEQGQAEQQDRQCTENRHRNGKRPVAPEAFTAHVGEPHQTIRRHRRSQTDDRD